MNTYSISAALREYTSDSDTDYIARLITLQSFADMLDQTESEMAAAAAAELETLYV